MLSWPPRQRRQLAWDEFTFFYELFACTAVKSLSTALLFILFRMYQVSKQSVLVLPSVNAPQDA